MAVEGPNHFGTDVQGAIFAEIPDGAALVDGTTRMKRPAADSVIAVRDSLTLDALPDITTDTYGYWSYVVDDVGMIDYSGDGGDTWKGPLKSREQEFFDSSLGREGKSTYDVYVDATVAGGGTPLDVDDWLDAQKGEPGSPGADGITMMGARLSFPDKPQIGDVSDPFPVPYGGTIMRRINMGLDEAPASGEYELSLFLNNVDLLTPLGKTLKCGIGVSAATVLLDTPISIDALDVLTFKILNKAADGAGTAVPPVLRAFTVYASGVAGAPATLGSSVSFATSLALPTYVEGDELRVSIMSNLQPTVTSSTGTWLQVGSVATDTNGFGFQTTWRKTAIDGEANPTVTFSGNAGMAAILGSYYTVDSANPIDGTPVSAAQSTSSATYNTSAQPATAHDAEAAVLTVAARFGPSAATSLMNTPAGLTKLAEALTSRGTSPNYCVTLYYVALPTAGGTVTSKTVAFQTTAVAWWYNRMTAMIGGATDNPGTRPWGDVFVTQDVTGG